jgi:hypothetical protein
MMLVFDMTPVCAVLHATAPAKPTGVQQSVVQRDCREIGMMRRGTVTIFW